MDQLRSLNTFLRRTANQINRKLNILQQNIEQERAERERVERELQDLREFKQRMEREQLEKREREERKAQEDRERERVEREEQEDRERERMKREIQEKMKMKRVKRKEQKDRQWMEREIGKLRTAAQNMEPKQRKKSTELMFNLATLYNALDSLEFDHRKMRWFKNLFLFLSGAACMCVGLGVTVCYL